MMAGLAYPTFKAYQYMQPTFERSFGTVAQAEEGFRVTEVPHAEAIQEGEMIVVTIGEGEKDKVIVAKFRGKLYSVGNYCTHFGLPLGQSLLLDDKVVCMFHGAAFSLIDGYAEHAPGLDALPTFEIIEEDGKISVKTPYPLPGSQTMDMAKRDPENTQKYVIVGGGAAGLSCAETLRQSDYTGEITVLSNDNLIPYDRTLLSKALPFVDAAKMPMRSNEFLEKYDIDYLLNTNVKKINSEARTVTLSDDTEISFDKLLIATGGYARKPIIPGIDLEGVHPIRTGDDHKKAKGDAETAKNIVVLGASFIGMESASAIKGRYKDANITIVDVNETPFQRTLGKDIGGLWREIFEAKGVNFSFNSGIKAIKGADGRVTSVELADGTTLDADMVIYGAGIQPATQILDDKFSLAKDGSVVVDAYLKANDHIYAAGDVATYPYWLTGDKLRTEHWNHAIQQGEVAAFNMMGKGIAYDFVPFFWTRNFDKGLVFCGHNHGHDDVIIDGELDASDPKFMAYYVRKNKIIGAAAMGRLVDVHIMSEALRLGVAPTPESVRDGSTSIQDIKEKVQSRRGASKCRRKNCCKKKAAKL